MLRSTHVFALLPLIFFFYCYGHHRDLHSFPTRRSSDLWQPSSCLAARYRTRPTRPRWSPSGRVGRERYRDRKSTRLNSSHVEISYAVFCLKKKKITKQTTRYSMHHERRHCPAEVTIQT